MFLLVPVHPGCPRQNPERCEMVVVVVIVFLSHVAMLMQYLPSSCVRLCGVDVAYWWLSDWTRLHLACADSSTCSGQSILFHEGWLCDSSQMSFAVSYSF